MKRFENKVAIVTGGSGSIGFATAKNIASEGARVLIVDINENSLKERVAEAQKEGLEISYEVADVTLADDVKKYVDTAVKRYGKIDLFFNNAGIEGVVKPIIDYPEDTFDKVMAVNVKGVFLGIKYVAPNMKDNGSIVITSSVAGLIGNPGTSAYNTSKHAVIGTMRVAAQELGERGIRVNSVHPGPVDNRMMRSLEEEAKPGHGNEVKAGYEQQIPLKRYAKPEDVVSMVAFLFSNESEYISGNTFVVDGGMSAG